MRVRPEILSKVNNEQFGSIRSEVVALKKASAELDGEPVPYMLAMKMACDK